MSSILKVKTWAYSVAADFDPEVTLGISADEGTEFADPETQTEGVASGSQASVGATHSPTIRVLGPGTVFLSDLQGYIDDLTEIYVRGYAANGLDYTQAGPYLVNAAFAKGRTTDPRRQSVIIQLSASADYAHEIIHNDTNATS